MSDVWDAPFQRRKQSLDAWPVVLCGLLISTVALLRAPWPADPALLSIATVSHYQRLTGHQAVGGQGAGWVLRRVADALALCAVGGGYVGVGLALLSGTRWATAAMLAASVFGVAYSATLGLFPGPILACTGFLLVAIGLGLHHAVGL